MKGIRPPWLVACIASSFSFLFEVFSVLLSKLFGAWNDDLYKNIIFTLKKIRLEKLFLMLENKNNSLADYSVVISVLFFIIILMFENEKLKLALKKTINISFDFTFLSLYNNLKKYPHPYINFKILSNFVRVSFWSNIILMCVYWVTLNSLSLFICLVSLIIFLLGGIINHIQFNKWMNEMKWLNGKEEKNGV